MFAWGQPTSAQQLARALGTDEATIRQALQELERHLQEGGRGIQLVEVAGGFMLVTRARYFPFLRRMGRLGQAVSLSRAALETLAVVAYHQPVSRAEVERLRGVDCESALATLLERGFIEVAGHRAVPGRPALYRTTARFLAHFGLRSLEELPPLPATPPGSASEGHGLSRRGSD